jgi:glutamyl aminopeptidase
MDTWTLQKGYPVLQIDRNGTKLKLTQKWFLLNPLNSAQNNSIEYKKYKWYIPFTYTTKKIQDFDIESRPNWFNKNDAECILFFF